MIELKVFILCFGILAVATIASPVYDSKPERKDSVSGYDLHPPLTKDGKETEEQLVIDTEKKTEKFHLQKTSDNDDETDIIYDFRQNRTMFRVPAAESCFLYNSTGNLPKPDDFKQFLDTAEDEEDDDPGFAEKDEFEVVGPVFDSSLLSDEMAGLCAKMRIYYIAMVTAVEESRPEAKRSTKLHCEMKFICNMRCTNKCLFSVCAAKSCYPAACRWRC